MHFLIWETLSFNLMYVTACYLVGTGMCHNMVGLLQHYIVVPPNTEPRVTEQAHVNFGTFRRGDKRTLDETEHPRSRSLLAQKSRYCIISVS